MPLEGAPARPSFWRGAPLADGALAVACYIAAYRLRFDVAEFWAFWPTASRLLPIMVACQLGSLAAVGAYAHREGRRWLPRLVLGIVIGSGLGTLLAVWIFSFLGLSRASFVIGPLLLLITAFGWRGAAGLMRLGRHARDLEQADEAMVDRADIEGLSVSAGMLGVFNHRELIRHLVLRDLKLKYRGSALGFLWSLVNPLLMIAVYSLAFTYVLGVRTEGFVFLLLLSLLAWTFFASSLAMAAGSIADNGGLVKSVFFPRAVLPIANVLFNFSHYVLTIAVFLPLMLVLYRVPLSPAMLLYPVFLALQLLCTIGFAFIIATGTAFFRDVRHILEISLSALFWTTPIVYAFRQLPEPARLPIMLSPMSSFIVAYQEIFFYRTTPDLSLWLAAIIYGLGTFIIGAVVFTTYENRFTELI